MNPFNKDTPWRRKDERPTRNVEMERVSRLLLNLQRQRRQRLRRALILLLMFLMLLTGIFGVMADNPITGLYREQIGEGLGKPYLDPLNSYLRSVSAPTVEPRAEAEQASSSPNPSAAPGLDIVGLLVQLFSSDQSAPAAQQPDPLAGVEKLIFGSATAQALAAQNAAATNAAIASAVAATSAAETENSVLSAQSPISAPPILPATLTPTSIAQNIAIMPAQNIPPVVQPHPTRKPRRQPTPAPTALPPTALPPNVLPGIASTTPADGAVNVWPGANIVIVFTESVNVDATSFSIECFGPETFTLTGSGSNTITLDPDFGLGQGAPCSVMAIAANIIDAANPPDTMAADSIFYFTTGDYGAPSVTGASLIFGNAIEFTFNEAISYVNPASFTIDCGTGPLSYTDLMPDGFTVDLTVVIPPPSGAACAATAVAANINDVDLQDPPDTMAADYVFNFIWP